MTAVMCFSHNTWFENIYLKLVSLEQCILLKMEFGWNCVMKNGWLRHYCVWRLKYTSYTNYFKRKVTLTKQLWIRTHLKHEKSQITWPIFTNKLERSLLSLISLLIGVRILAAFKMFWTILNLVVLCFHVALGNVFL